MSTQTQRETPPTNQALRAWQDTVGAWLGGCSREANGLGAGIFGLRIDPSDVRQSFGRIADETRELTRAQLAVASEWIRSPLWLIGAASPSELQESYSRLFQAFNKVLRAYVSATTPAWQAAERGAGTGIDVAGRRAKAARDITKDVVKAQGATLVASGEATAGAASDSLINGNINARGQSEQIKGKVSRSGEKIHHLPGQANYDRFETDALFETEADARAAGYRASLR